MKTIGTSYNRDDISTVLNEMFNEDTSKIMPEGINGLTYDEETDCYNYKYGGGDASVSTYIVKIENQTYSDGIYSITLLYATPGENDYLENTVDDCDCYRTTVEVKENQDYKYSKYQLMNLDSMTNEKVGLVKDFKEN